MTKEEFESDVYQCCACGRIFKKARTDEEALVEAEENFGEIDLEECVYLCDDCYKIAAEVLNLPNQ